MMSAQNPVRFQQPVLQHDLVPTQIHDLFSLLQSETLNNSDSIRSVYSNAEKRRRRMMSNRESARRSRMLKKKHLEDLTNELNRLKLKNRNLKYRLYAITDECHSVQRETDRLLSQVIYLQEKLTSLRQILSTMQLNSILYQ